MSQHLGGCSRVIIAWESSMRYLNLPGNPPCYNLCLNLQHMVGGATTSLSDYASFSVRLHLVVYYRACTCAVQCCMLFCTRLLALIPGLPCTSCLYGLMQACHLFCLRPLASRCLASCTGVADS